LYSVRIQGIYFVFLHFTEGVLPMLETTPQYFWQLELPTFKACQPTRFGCLIFTGKTDEPPIISDTWEGGINPAQFWKASFYDPSNIFDKWQLMMVDEE
jgi:hypothetical protein